MIIPNIRICPSCHEPLMNVELEHNPNDVRMECEQNHQGGVKLWLYRSGDEILAANLYWATHHLHIRYNYKYSELYPYDKGLNIIRLLHVIDFDPTPQNIEHKIRTLLTFG